MIDKTHHGQREMRSYGRRRGRKRSARQEQIFKHGLKRWGVTLSDTQDLSVTELFAFHPAECWLEIGFGGGEHLIWQAERNPEVGFVAAEPFEDGVVKVLTAIEEKQLQNVRVFPGDARPLLRSMQADSIDKAFVLFPDPWPKTRHAKRRLVSTSLLHALARVMRDGATLRIGTDISGYAAAILETVQRHAAFVWDVKRPQDWRMRPSDWPQTRYEHKAIQAGRRPYFFQFHYSKSGKMVDDR